jgi:hypothetical protein
MHILVGKSVHAYVDQLQNYSLFAFDQKSCRGGDLGGEMY